MKRKADTTTPVAIVDVPPPPPEKVTKISTRRESGRPIKKPSKDLPEAPVIVEVCIVPNSAGLPISLLN